VGKEKFPNYTVRWVQPYSLSRFDAELIAAKMIAEMVEAKKLQESGYKEANQVIQRIKEKL